MLIGCPVWVHRWLYCLSVKTKHKLYFTFADCLGFLLQTSWQMETVLLSRITTWCWVMCHLAGIHYNDMIWLLLQNGHQLNWICVMISVSKRISNVQYCLGTWVRNDSNPGSVMLPSHMKLIMIPVTLFDYPKWPFKFLFRVMRLEVNSTPKQLNCADILIWYVLWVLNYIPKCKNLQIIISWQPAHGLHSKVFCWTMRGLGSGLK